jgi:hypothetical protein
MRWIRQHIRSCAWLALTALAFHFAFTFGHVHAGPFSPASTATAAITAVDAPTGGDADSASEERYRTLRAHHSCAICASISLLGTLVLPVAQALATPRAISDIRKPDPVKSVPPRGLRSSSPARAPPSA